MGWGVWGWGGIHLKSILSQHSKMIVFYKSNFLFLGLPGTFLGIIFGFKNHKTADNIYWLVGNV